MNLDSYKNIIGVIRQPEMTFICPEPLKTLPCPQILSGAAELLKTFIINNEGGEYERAVNMLGNIHKRTLGDSAEAAVRECSQTLRELIYAAARIKAAIAGRDPNERGSAGCSIWDILSPTPSRRIPKRGSRTERRWRWVSLWPPGWPGH